MSMTPTTIIAIVSAIFQPIPETSQCFSICAIAHDAIRHGAKLNCLDWVGFSIGSVARRCPGGATARNHKPAKSRGKRLFLQMVRP
jgi:hypothetical protein